MRRLYQWLTAKNGYNQFPHNLPERNTMLGVIIIIILIGVGLYLVNNYIKMSEPIKTILNIVVIIALCVWLLNIFGLVDSNVFNYHYHPEYHR